MNPASSAVALALFGELKANLTASLRQLAHSLAEAEDYLERSEPGEALSMLHHQVTELRLRAAALDTPLVSALSRLNDLNGQHKRGNSKHAAQD